MRSHYLPIAVAAAVAATGFSAPIASAEPLEYVKSDVAEKQLKAALPDIEVKTNVDNAYIAENFKSKFELPTEKPQDVVLQVGATQDSVLLNWITAPGVDGQTVRIREAGSAADTAKVIDAASVTSVVSLKEGYLNDPKAGPNILNDIAHHKATVTGLKENTKYTYQVGKDGAWSEEYTFNTGTYGDNWNFLFFGDPQLYSSHDLKAETAAWNNTVTEAAKKYPQTAFLLSAGDQANYSQLHEHSSFISPEVMKQYRVAVNNGNHDDVFKPSYDAFYNLPNQEDENYWFAYNNALVVSLDSNDWKDFDDDAAVVRKVVTEQGKDKDWVIVTFHHSLFSQAYHQEDRQIMYWRERMTPVFSELNVDLVLSGHDHIYTRTYLMDGQKPVNAGKPHVVGETVEKKPGQVQYVTANSASGSKYYKFFDFKTGKRDETEANTWTFEQSIQDKTARTYTEFWNQNFVPDYTAVEVTPESLKVTTYDMDKGDVLDAFTLKRAAEEKPGDTDNTNNGSTNVGSTNNGSTNNANGSSVGTALGVLAALLVVLGGGAFFALQQGLIPAQLAAMLPF